MSLNFDIQATACKFFSDMGSKLSFGSFLALIGLFIGDIFEPMTLAIIILLCVDVVTGIFFALSIRVFNSRKMFVGTVVKIGVYGGIILVLMCLAHQSTHFKQEIISVAFSSFAYAMIGLTELSSIFENLYKISECYELENLWWARGSANILKKVMKNLLVSYGCEDIKGKCRIKKGATDGIQENNNGKAT